MWTKYFKPSKVTNKGCRNDDSKSSIRCDKGLNLNEEYNRALRTQSYVEFFTKTQIMPSPSSFDGEEEPVVLLEPPQGSVPAILESAAVLSKLPDLEPLFRDFFDSTAEASLICGRLLAGVSRTHAARRMFDEMIISVEPETEMLVVRELASCVAEAENPFSFTGAVEFGTIRGRCAAVLERLKAKRRKVARRVKLIGCINRGVGISITAACGVLAVTAAVLAAHTLTAFVMGPLAVAGGFNPVKKVVNRVMRFKVMTSVDLLRRMWHQVDMATKGVYILNRDMDTVSRLVARLHDEVEHEKQMARFWMEKSKKFASDDNATSLFCMQVVNEMKRRGGRFRKQVEELEELLCLCLLTINRARGLVVEELTRTGASGATS